MIFSERYILNTLYFLDVTQKRPKLGFTQLKRVILTTCLIHEIYDIFTKFYFTKRLERLTTLSTSSDTCHSTCVLDRTVRGHRDPEEVLSHLVCYHDPPRKLTFPLVRMLDL